MGGWGSEKGGEVILTGNTREGGGVKMGGKMRVFEGFWVKMRGFWLKRG